ncbi:MAG: hypothetical protein DRI69_04035 [Bacteroidetes bacterium]|nr:MAG: hypothetical protein DRI69_04035 [Bacteroidota bacterium]
MHQSRSAKEADIGSPVSSVEIRNNAEFLRGGRYPVDQTFLPAIPHNFARGTYYSRVPNIDIALGSDLLRNVYQFSFLGLFIVVFCITLYKGLLRIDDTIHYLFIASILMYMLAYLIMLKLYIPVRQLEFALPVWALLVQSLLISRGIALLRTRRVRIGIRIGLITGTIIVCAVMVRISILPAHFAKRELVDVSEYTALYGALIDLPSDGLIASHPALADPIPTVTGRRVLFNTAMALPFFDKYWSEISNRARSFVEAYYSEDINEVIEFCNEFHVEYIIVRTSDFADAYLTKAHIAWEPYGTWVKEASANKHDFALPGIPDKCKLYNENGLFVISASTLKSDCD